MKKDNIKTALKVIFSLGLGILIFWYVYKDWDIDTLMDNLRGVRIIWIIIPLFIALLSHFLRAVRWKMLIDPLGKKVNLWNVYGAVMAGYCINYAVPRAGEIARCGLVKKYEGVPFTELLGTLIVDRSVDIIVEGLVILLTIALQYSEIMYLAKEYHLIEGAIGLLSNPITWIIIVSLIALPLLFRKAIKNTKIYAKIKEMLTNVVNGLKSVQKLEHKGLFILYSILIFVCYYFMFYLCFFAFDFTEDLSMLCGLTAFVMGSLGIIAPVQGGLGAWHVLVIGTLSTYGVYEAQAGSFALMVHGSQTLMLISVGILAMALMFYFNKKKTNA
ncbi:MAG: flippase-like domain-containing protein [Paludibacteraceae bacterium]|nr:flippase-like domain-containing protein [Paludibacteraceae bacterium]MBR4712296.1 flippase-like domain-containing protein [Paludibacteraceae bacterium]